MTPHLPVCGAVVGTGRALVGPVTADIGHLLVTVMTPITGTLTVKHVTLIVNYSKSENDKVRHHYLKNLTKTFFSVYPLVNNLFILHTCMRTIFLYSFFRRNKIPTLCLGNSPFLARDI